MIYQCRCCEKQVESDKRPDLDLGWTWGMLQDAQSFYLCDTCGPKAADLVRQLVAMIHSDIFHPFRLLPVNERMKR